MSKLDYRRLSYLASQMRLGKATKKEKEEYMKMLHENGSITTKQYESFLANGAGEEFANAALAIGAVILLGYLLSEMFNTK